MSGLAVRDGFRLIFSKQGGRIEARLPWRSSVRCNDSAVAEWRLSFFSSKVEGGKSICFFVYDTGDADDAEARRSQTTAYDSMPRAKHAKVAMCMF